MLMRIAVTVLQIVFDHVQEVPVGVSVFAGPNSGRGNAGCRHRFRFACF